MTTVLVGDIVISTALLQDASFPLSALFDRRPPIESKPFDLWCCAACGEHLDDADAVYAYNGDEGISEFVHEACKNDYPFSSEDGEPE